MRLFINENCAFVDPSEIILQSTLKNAFLLMKYRFKLWRSYPKGIRFLVRSAYARVCPWFIALTLLSVAHNNDCLVTMYHKLERFLSNPHLFYSEIFPHPRPHRTLDLSQAETGRHKIWKDSILSETDDNKLSW